ncbi:hypothetical protein FQN57_006887 [Myotisia sp. PD_48]|nr:hypothetical protein FQN57_006887 [Myotisia sp. PD_48]
MSMKCVHKSCGKEFSDADEPCVYHPGPPEFHEGQKGWKCCKPRVLTFEEFLAIPPCTTGKHSTVDDTPVPETKPSATDAAAIPVGITKPITPRANVLPPSLGATGAHTPTPKGSPAPPEDESDDPSLEIPVNKECRRRGCNATFNPAVPRTDDEGCIHHPGQPIFHEGSKGWSCCKRRVLEFDEFMKIQGCATNKRHLFIGKGKPSAEATIHDVRTDFYQTPSTVIASIYLKKIKKEQAKIEFSSPTTIDFDLPTSDNTRFQKTFSLYGPIDIEKSKYSIMGTKMELTLAKANGESWPVLKSDDPHTGEIIQAGRATRAIVQLQRISITVEILCGIYVTSPPQLSPIEKIEHSAIKVWDKGRRISPLRSWERKEIHMEKKDLQQAAVRDLGIEIYMYLLRWKQYLASGRLPNIHIYLRPVFSPAKPFAGEPPSAMSTQSEQKRYLAAPRFIPLSYNHADSQASALRLVLTLNPHWKDAEGNIEFLRFTDGITNTLLKIVLRAPGLSEEEIDNDAVLMRAYGNHTEIIIDRERETRSHALLASRGLAPPLLARFTNGLLYRFIRGQAASPDDLTSPSIWRGVARRLAEWHAVLPISDIGTNSAEPESPSSDTLTMQPTDASIDSDHKRCSSLSDITPIEPRQQPPNLWTVLQKWIIALPQTTEQQRSRRKLLQRELERTVAELDDGSGLGEGGLVFAHCDLLSANVIVQSRSKNCDPDVAESVNFIDYEYATPSPAAFDLANHFAEWVGYDCDYNRVPTRSVRRGFIQEYIDSYSQHAALPGTKQEAVDNLFADVERYRGIPGFYWGVWALIQATISQIDFDYSTYAELRLQEYWGWRHEQDNSRTESGAEMPLREQRWAQEA